MTSKEFVSRRNADGSLDVWVQGWRVRFPRDAEPEVEKSAPPAGLGEKADAGEVVGDVAGSPGVGFGDWIVVLRDGGPLIVPGRPEKAAGSSIYRRIHAFEQRGG